MMRGPRSLGENFIVLSAIFLLGGSAQAGPLQNLRSLSQLPPLDLGRLKNGQIVTKRGADGNFARGISLESCYIVPAPVAVVGEKLIHWDPTHHPNSDTRLYREYHYPAPGDVFQTVQLNPSIENDRWLLDHTYNIAGGAAPSDLHLTAAEVAIIRKELPTEKAAAGQSRHARANNAWGEILRGRSGSFARGGMTGVPPYSAGGSISPGSEFQGLFTLNPKAAKYFHPILSAKPLVANGPPADEAVGYWEAALVRGHTTLQLGVFAARKSANSWQLIDCVYYPTDTYFMALDVFQLWPVDGGTLVWQVGFVSAPFRSYLGGIDRYVAGKQMTEETLQTIKTFRASFQK